MNRISLLTAALVTVLLALLAASCSNSQTGASLVARANSRCPIPIENVGFVSSISLDGQTLVYDCMVTEQGIDLDALGAHTDVMKRAMLPTIPTLFDADPELLDQLKREGWTLSVRYHDASGRSVTVDFPASDFGDDAQRDAAKLDSPAQRLADELALTEAGLPAEMVPGITITSVADTLGYVTFRCAVDESGLRSGSLDSLRVHASEIRHNMSQALLSEGDPSVDRMVDITLAAGRGLKYYYVGTVSGDTLSIGFGPSELVR